MSYQTSTCCITKLFTHNNSKTPIIERTYLILITVINLLKRFAHDKINNRMK